MATKAQKTKVGIFMVVCGLLMGGGLLAISGYKTVEYHEYWIEFDESVLGLSVDGLVEYLGVPVGRVGDIYVDENNMAHVDILINPKKVTLHKGVTAQLAWYSIATGTLCVSLSGGDGTELPYNSQISVKPSLVKAVSSKLENVIADISQITGAIKDGLAGMEEGDISDAVKLAKGGLEELGPLLISGREFIEAAKESLDEVKKEAFAGVDEIKKLAKDLRLLSDETRQLIRKTQDKVEELDLEQTQVKFGQVLENIAALSERIEQSLGTLDQVAISAMHEANTIEFGMRETLRTLSEALDAFRDLAQYLQDDPSSLIRGKGKRTGDS